MEIQTFENAFDALADTPAEAANLKARAELMRRVCYITEGNQWTQAQAAVHCGITLRRINDLVKGRIARFSPDDLFKSFSALK